MRHLTGTAGTAQRQKLIWKPDKLSFPKKSVKIYIWSNINIRRRAVVFSQVTAFPINFSFNLLFIFIFIGLYITGQISFLEVVNDTRFFYGFESTSWIYVSLVSAGMASSLSKLKVRQLNVQQVFCFWLSNETELSFGHFAFLAVESRGSQWKQRFALHDRFNWVQ